MNTPLTVQKRKFIQSLPRTIARIVEESVYEIYHRDDHTAACVIQLDDIKQAVFLSKYKYEIFSLLSQITRKSVEGAIIYHPRNGEESLGCKVSTVKCYIPTDD